MSCQNCYNWGQQQAYCPYCTTIKNGQNPMHQQPTYTSLDVLISQALTPFLKEINETLTRIEKKLNE